MEIPFQSRRKFVFAVISGVVALTGLGRFLKSKSVQKKVIVSASLDSIPVESALVFRDERVAIVRGRDGFYALSLVCTHLGCTVSVAADRIYCPCHGSQFDRDGAVLQGPAVKPLVRLSTEIRDGRLFVSS